MLSGFQRADYRRRQQTFKIDKQSCVDIAENIPHRKGQSGIGKPDPDERPADNSGRNQDSKHVCRPHAFVPHQHNIAHRRQNGKYSQQISGPAYKGLCRRNNPQQQRPDGPGVSPLQECEQILRSEEAEGKEEDCKAEEADRTVAEEHTFLFSAGGQEQDQG